MEVSMMFTFIASLAAVINGLGIVRILSELGEYIRRRDSIEFTHHWVHTSLILFQLLAHVLIWWNLVALREVASINFLQYLYILLGPTLLFISTALLVPRVSESKLDLKFEYARARNPYFSGMTIFWAWGIAVWPVLGYGLSPVWKMAATWMAIMLIMRLTSNEKVHAVLAVAIWLLIIVYISIYAMQLGYVGRLMNQ